METARLSSTRPKATATMYKRSLADPNAFWAKEAERIHWYTNADR